MDSYGDGNVYRGQVCKDPEIKTIVINRQTPNYEKGCRMSKVKFPKATGAKTLEGLDIIQWSEYYPAESVERLVEAARQFEEVGWTQRGWEDCLQKLKAALEPFNK